MLAVETIFRPVEFLPHLSREFDAPGLAAHAARV
jgi:hypothetical protein